MYDLICYIFSFTLITFFFVVYLFIKDLIKYIDKSVAKEKAEKEAQIRSMILKELKNEKKDCQ